MQDLETAMAKALDGQFFWEHTAEPSEQTSGDSRAIIVAQRKFQGKRIKTPEELRFEKLEYLRDIVRKERPGFVLARDVNLHIEDEIKQFAKSLKEVVAEVHGVSPDIVTSQSRGLASKDPKHHFAWGMVRYFPRLTMQRIADVIERDRATLYHSDKRFTNMMEKYADMIVAVDAIVGYSE